MLDLGANASCTPEQLCQFAVMGSVLAADLEGAHENGRGLGLLNIGEEEIKGNETVQSAHNLIAASGVNYVGFVEGHDIFSDEVDVVVTDGFTGNVALEDDGGSRPPDHGGAARGVHAQCWRVNWGRLRPQPSLRALRARMDPRRYNGATMVGLNGIVIKSHGGADLFGFQRAIEVAVLEARSGVPARIAQRSRRNRLEQGRHHA